MTFTKNIKAQSVKALTAVAVSAALLCSQSAAAASSVWKVSKGDDYLYVAGSVHILPESALQVPAEFSQAYQDADSLVLEAKVPPADDQAAQLAMLKAMSFSAGEKLSDKLSPAVYQKLAAYFAQYGVQINQLDGFKPGFISLQMMAIEMQKHKFSTEGVDSQFSKRAETDGKPQHYLETLDSQIALLAAMGEGFEDAFIELSLQQSKDFAAYFDTMLQSWRSGDLQQIDAEVIQPIRQLDEQMYQSMLAKRNQAWLPQIEQMFGNSETELVLVGAGHLPGADGVLTLLQNKGYQLQQISVAP